MPLHRCGGALKLIPELVAWSIKPLLSAPLEHPSKAHFPRCLLIFNSSTSWGHGVGRSYAHGFGCQQADTSSSQRCLHNDGASRGAVGRISLPAKEMGKGNALRDMPTLGRICVLGRLWMAQGKWTARRQSVGAKQRQTTADGWDEDEDENTEKGIGGEQKGRPDHGTSASATIRRRTCQFSLQTKS